MGRQSFKSGVFKATFEAWRETTVIGQLLHLRTMLTVFLDVSRFDSLVGSEETADILKKTHNRVLRRWIKRGAIYIEKDGDPFVAYQNYQWQFGTSRHEIQPMNPQLPQPSSPSSACVYEFRADLRWRDQSAALRILIWRVQAAAERLVMKISPFIRQCRRRGAKDTLHIGLNLGRILHSV